MPQTTGVQVSFFFTSQRLLASVMALALASMTIGCGGSGDPLGRLPLSGTVTMDGSPLATGTIRFDPFGVTDPKAKTTSSGGVISGGKYTIPQPEGLPPGKYTVVITSTGDAGTQSLPSDPQEAMDAAAKQKPLTELIPAQYNSQTELVIEVVKGGEKPFDFQLTSTKK